MNIKGEKIGISIKKNIEKEKSKSPEISKTGINWANLSRYFLLSLVFLLPFWVLPFADSTLSLSKSFLFYALIIAATIFYLIYLLQKGSIKLPRSFLLLALCAIVAISLISSLFSENISISLFGKGGEVDTFFSLLILSVGLFLVSSLFQSEKRALLFFLLLIISSFIVFIFQFFHSVFGVTLYPWDLFPRKVDTLVGSWNELAIFFGFIALGAIIFFEFFKVGRRLRLFLISVMAISLLSMAFINFTTAWVVFGIFLLVFLVYLYSLSRESRNFAHVPLFIVLIAMFFILARAPMGDFISSIDLDSIEVRPSWGATLEVTKDTWADSAKNVILGSGPNTFLYDWIKFKPAEINQTVFWNTRFTSGIGLLPSFSATLGILGVLAWLFFLIVIIFYGLRAISYSGNETLKCLLLVTFLGSVYLWVFNIISVPGNFLFILSFLVTGLFLALLIKSQKVQLKEFSYTNQTTLGFISALIIVFLLILSVAAFYLLFQKYWASRSFTQGLIALNVEGNLEKAQSAFAKAVRFDAQDRYHRALGEVGLIQLSQVLNQQLTPEEMRLQFQNILAFTIQHARTAVQLNSLDSANWILLGQIYESIIPFNIEGAEQFSIDAYRAALDVAPHDPRPLLFSARVEVQSGDNESARTFLGSALEIKRNYTPALFLLAQIEAQEGNLKEAIQQIELTRLLAPNDIGILFQLGLLYYQDKEYENAGSIFERTVIINPNYSNARYFLGLVYDKLGRQNDAIEQFTQIQALNPGNAEVEKILSNLRAGREALSEISPPEPAPEEREEPPIDEQE